MNRQWSFICILHINSFVCDNDIFGTYDDVVTLDSEMMREGDMIGNEVSLADVEKKNGRAFQPSPNESTFRKSSIVFETNYWVILT